MRKHRLQIGEQRKLDTRSSQLRGVECDRRDGLFPQWCPQFHVAPRPGNDRASGKSLPALEADEMNQRRKHSMLG